MKIKTNIVTLLAVLAILGSLVAIVAVPAGAVTAGFTVTLSPATAYANAQTGYTIPFTTTSAIPAGGTITITFPTGTVMPGSIAKGYVTWTGADSTGPAWGTIDPDPSVSGTSVIIQIPSLATAAQRAAGSHKVVISQTAGIKNPALSKTTSAAEPYKILVDTSGDNSPAYSAAYAVEDYVTFTPASGAYGSAVTVTGGGFSPGSSVTITGGAMGAGDVGSDGKFSATCAAVFAQAITATDGTGRTATSTSPAAFNLLPTLIVGPPISGNVGTTVYLTGRHFTAGGNIASLASATFGGTALGALYVTGTGASQIGATFTDLDADGALDDFNAYFVVPACQNAGLTTISITDSGSKVGTGQFTVNPRTLDLGPTSGAPGITVTVTGGGFAASATGGTITLGQSLTDTWTGIGTDGNGAFVQVITIPSIAIAGALPVTFSIAGCTKTVNFTVTGNVLNLSSSSGPKGSYVTIWGSGMTTGGTITSLKIGTVPLTYTGTITIDSAGNIQAVTATIPAGAGWGSQIITATDNGTPAKTATATYTVAQPSIAISPPDGYMGDMVTITGTGWLPGARGMVTITVPNAIAPTITTPADDGSFTAAVGIPVTGVVGPRAVTITAADSATWGNTAPSKTFMVKSASISVDPAVQAATKTVTLTGLGFTPQSPVSEITIAGADIPTTPELVVTDALGKFTCTFVVPGLVGVKTIGAKVMSDTRTTFLTITAAPVTVGVQTASISSKLVRIWGYSGGTWYMYDPATPAINDLITLEPGNGYWVKVSEDCTLVYGGYSKALKSSDWNLIAGPY